MNQETTEPRTQDRIVFTSEEVIATATRIKLIVSGKVCHRSYNDVNFFIHRVGKHWKSTEVTTGRSLIPLSETKKQSITDTQRFIDHIKDMGGVLSGIVDAQINDSVLSTDDLDFDQQTRRNGV